MANGFQRSGFQHPGFQTGGAAPGPTYGGVWMYGLKHWRALRGELEEPEPEVVDTVAAIVKRTPYPDQDAASRILLRLELEARDRAWEQIYLDTLEAYRAGFGEYLDELRAQDRARREAMAVAQLERDRAAAAALLKRRRLAAFLLLDS